TLRRFQVRYMNIPNLSKPVQPLDVWYSSGYAQDEWRPRSNVTVTGGVRVDVASFGKTAYDNPNVDALTFRDQKGNPIQYNTGAPASSVDLAVTDRNFKFPQTWRSNIAVDRRLPWGFIGTGEFIYNRDVNGMAYINANLPAAQSAFTGPDNRPRWVGVVCGS